MFCFPLFIVVREWNDDAQKSVDRSSIIKKNCIVFFRSWPKYIVAKMSLLFFFIIWFFFQFSLKLKSFEKLEKKNTKINKNFHHFQKFIGNWNYN